MVLKTFSVEKDVYEKFSRFCKERGMSMSKQIEIFMEFIIEDEPVAKQACLEKIERVRKGRFIPVDDFGKRYGS